MNENQTRSLLNELIRHYGEIRLLHKEHAFDELTNIIRGSRASREDLAQLVALATRRLWNKRSDLITPSAN